MRSIMQSSELWNEDKNYKGQSDGCRPRQPGNRPHLRRGALGKKHLAFTFQEAEN